MTEKKMDGNSEKNKGDAKVNKPRMKKPRMETITYEIVGNFGNYKFSHTFEVK